MQISFCKNNVLHKPNRKRRNRKSGDEPMEDADDGGGKPAAVGSSPGGGGRGLGYTFLKIASLGMLG